jgi:predicted RNA-binding protein YlqC (UPF0109 family)
MSTIQETLEYIVKAIVTDSSSIKINSREEADVLILEIEAAPEIIGQIIGKEGKIIKSIRTILNLSFPNQKYSLDVKG